MKNYTRSYPVCILAVVFLLLSVAASAQANRHPARQRKLAAASFKRTFSMSIGYGLPNVDKKYLPWYYDAYYGSNSQKGPVTASLDYRFSRKMSIGFMVTHGTVSAPYYDYFSGLPAFNTKLDNWGFMLNLVRYFRAGPKIAPYFHTAIGFNKWTQEYTDPAGNKLSMPEADLPSFSRQIALGVKYNVSSHAGLFVEAGYGKYILNGGLSLQF
jgi:hypothetical protein